MLTLILSQILSDDIFDPAADPLPTLMSSIPLQILSDDILDPVADPLP